MWYDPGPKSGHTRHLICLYGLIINFSWVLHHHKPSYHSCFFALKIVEIYVICSWRCYFCTWRTIGGQTALWVFINHKFVIISIILPDKQDSISPSSSSMNQKMSPYTSVFHNKPSFFGIIMLVRKADNNTASYSHQKSHNGHGESCTRTAQRA